MKRDSTRDGSTCKGLVPIATAEQSSHMTEPHDCEYRHDCPTLDELLPRFYAAPTLSFGHDHYRVLTSLLYYGFDSIIGRLDMVGLDDSVMSALREARDEIDSELACEDPVHHEIFEQFMKDGMKFLPALRAAHRV